MCVCVVCVCVCVFHCVVNAGQVGTDTDKGLGERSGDANRVVLQGQVTHWV